MSIQRYSVEFDDPPPGTFLVGKERWGLTALHIDEQGQLCKLEGKNSEGRQKFNPTQVRESYLIIDKVREILEGFHEDSDDYYPGYVNAFAGGHKPGCPMAMPEIREKIPFQREDIKMKLKKRYKEMKLSNVDVSNVDAIDIEATLRGKLCTCDSTPKE